jgi:hypothetical protein
LSFLKKLLPIAGAAAGFYLGPAGSAAVSSALGSGIGTLLAGGNLKDAIKNSAIAGIVGGGLQSAQAASATQAAGQTAAATQAAQAKQALAAMEGSQAAIAKELAKETAKETTKKGIASYLTPGNVLLGTSLLGGLLAEEPEQPELTEDQKRMMRTGERTDYEGDPNLVARLDYNDRNAIARARSVNGVLNAAQGGFIQGPGTGTSDSIPAMIYQGGKPVQEARLSNNEFVFTEKAVQGAGGPARMYEMMKQYERMA